MNWLGWGRVAYLGGVAGGVGIASIVKLMGVSGVGVYAVVAID